MQIKVVIADDHKIVREGLKSLLEKSPDVEVVGEASDGRAALTMAQQLVPDIVVMDINMPMLNGVDATSQLLESLPGVKVIALSMYSNKRFVQRMFRAGASGYLLKDCAYEELAFAISSVCADKKYLSPGLAGTLIEDYMGHVTSVEEVDSPALTAREREVLQLISEGWSTQSIAEKLNLSIKTIESHRRRIMERLNIESIAGLTKYAIREGVTSL